MSETSQLPYANKISESRKEVLIRYLSVILYDLPMIGTSASPIKGVGSLAQEILNRVESIAGKNLYEYLYLVDCVTALIRASKNAEVQIFDKLRKRVLTKEETYKELGLFMGKIKDVSGAA